MNLFSKKTQLRQNTTRTPSANKSVYTYYQKRSNSDPGMRKKPSEAPPKRSKQHFIHHIPTFVLVIAVLFSLLYLSTVDPNVKIVVLNDQSKKDSTSLRQEFTYQQTAEQFVKKSLVNRSKFMLDTSGLSNELRSQFLELAAVSVTVPIISRRPVVQIQATKPAFILKSDKTVLIGNNGVALLETKDVKNLSRLNLRSVTDQSGISIEIGKAALPQEQTAFISTVIEQLEKQNIGIEAITIPASPYDLQIKIQGKPYYVKFNILEDPKQQAGSFIALKKDLESRNATVMEYVDVRAGERIFYK